MNWKMALVLGRIGAVLLIASVLSDSQAALVEASKKITGAGASFPRPIYVKWAEAYKEKTGIEVDYQSIGSSAGIDKIKQGSIDFGASDVPLEMAELVKNDLVQFPAIIGGIVLVVNIEGLKNDVHINLTAEIVGDIYKGKIKKWSHEAIQKENPTIILPDKNITVIHRSDGSGTTFIFSTYLSENDVEWREKVGAGTEIQWPIGLGEKGNKGVAEKVKAIPNSIGYVEYANANFHNLSWTTLTNKEGKVVRPTLKSYRSAAVNAQWDEKAGYYQVLTNQPGAKSWPITGVSFILFKQDKVQNKRVKNFFKWCFENGEKLSMGLDYAHLPEALIAKLKTEILKIK